MTENPYLTEELKYFLYTFKRQPILIKKAKNGWVWDEKGGKYFDFFSGLAVCGVGHNNARVVKAVQRQAAQLIHSSNFFYTKPQFELAKALTEKFKPSRVFFSNSGAEANELAIKLARLWATKEKKKGREIITFQNSFHGRTMGTLSATNGGRKSKSYFSPLLPGFKSIPFNDLKKLRSAITKNTIAVILEPVQGEGGINVATKEFFKGTEILCRKHDLLLILDEIQSGMGRSGTFFAFEQYGVNPDIVTLAKGLAGGLPLGATLAKPRVAKHMAPGLHGSTFGGNPVSCAASLEVLKILSPRALRLIRKTGDTLKGQLTTFTRYSSVKSIRGLGLLLAIDLHKSGAPYVTLARKRGLLINCTQDTVLRFLPPYFMSRSEIDQCLSILKSVFDTLG